MNRILIAAMIVFSVGLMSCRRVIIGGEGPVVAENRAPGYFDRLELQDGIQVYINHSNEPKFSVRIEAPENIVPYIETTVVNDKLIIQDRRRRNWRNGYATVYVTVDTLEEITSNGSGDIYASNLMGPSTYIGISGSGDMDLGMNITNDVRLDISGSGDLEMTGGAHLLDMYLSGSGDFQGRNFNVDNCEIDVTGSGNAEVYVSDSLDVRITGSGDVYYWGNPGFVSQWITGSGNLIKK